MAVTEFQSEILKRLAQRRKQQAERYVAGGVALNVLLKASRRSRDIDVFHDSDQALAASWTADRELLQQAGYEVHILREAPSFVEAVIQRGPHRTVMQWARESAFRFFPLIEDSMMGLALHPFDLATNKVLAMAGRLEVRDWIDVLNCDMKLQPLGYLIWAACGKDPGYNPRSLLESARRLHYSQVEINALDFEGHPPDAATLGRTWHDALEQAQAICSRLPPTQAGMCVVTRDGELFRGKSDELDQALRSDVLDYHPGTLGGSWPKIVGS